MIYDNLSQSLAIWGVTIAILFVVMVFGMWRNIIYLHASHKAMTRRLKALRISKMLSRLNITLSRYYHKTSDLDKERHIRKCESCPDPEQCDSMLAGEDIDPYTFCPNYHELRKLKADNCHHPKRLNVHASLRSR